MEMKLYSVFDKKTCVYSPPFLAHNNGHAIRLVTDTMADKNTSLSRHPADYCLHEIGSFDDGVGRLLPIESGAVGVIELSELLSEGKES